MDRNPFEFEITKRMISRYVKPGDTVLDIGGGPGRYSIWLAAQGCKVTLADLSDNCIKFAKTKASELNLPLTTICADAREIGAAVSETFDHVLLMGPLYHLLEESDRITAVNSAMTKLKSGGCLFASFITLFSQAIEVLENYPEVILTQDPTYTKYLKDNKSWAYSGNEGFTAAYFITQNEVMEFMSKYPLKRLHFFAQEGIISMKQRESTNWSEDVRNAWLDVAFALCELPELIGYAQHLMYIGQKL